MCKRWQNRRQERQKLDRKGGVGATKEVWIHYNRDDRSTNRNDHSMESVQMCLQRETTTGRGQGRKGSSDSGAIAGPSNGRIRDVRISQPERCK